MGVLRICISMLVSIPFEYNVSYTQALQLIRMYLHFIILVGLKHYYEGQ